MRINEDTIALIKKGFSLNKINKITGINKSSLYYHYKKINGKKYKEVSIMGKDLEALGEFIGIFAGDGNFYLDNKYHYKIRIYTGAHEEEYAYHLTKFFEKLFLKAPRKNHCIKNNVIITEYYSKKIFLLIKKYLEWEKNKTKTVRLKDIKNCKKEFLIGFLRGLFDTDGGIYKPKNKVAFGTASKNLAYQIKEILIYFGLKPGFYKYKNKDFWYIDLYGKRTDKFMKIIKPNNPNKKITR